MVIGPSFNVKGIEPPGVRTASLDDRQLFWAAVAGFVVEAKAQELMAGLDRFGNAFAPLKPKTIRYRRSAMGPADPNAPALQPAHGLSRTRSLFSVETTSAADGLVCFWAFDSVTGDSWGEILDYHRQGAGNLPVRDVFGLSPASLGVVKQRAADWWRGYVLADGIDIGPAPMPTGTPPGFKGKRSGFGKRVGGKIVRVQDRGQIYDLIGGMGFGAPPPTPPPVYRNRTPKPPALPTAATIRKRARGQQ